MSKRSTRAFGLLLTAIVLASAGSACTFQQAFNSLFYTDADATAEMAEYYENETLEAERGANNNATATEVAPGPGATTDAQSSGEAASAESCVAPTEAYSQHFEGYWEEGTRARQCTFRFMVDNTSTEELCFRLWEAFDDLAVGGDGWAGMTRVGPQGNFSKAYSYVEWNDGSVTFSIPVRMMIVRCTRECEQWLGGLGEDPFVDHSVVFGDPCDY